MRHTPLYDKHIALGGKMIDFGGWALPVQYEKITQEHLTVRKWAGLFDVSHMGEILVSGSDAEIYIQYLVTNDISGMAAGQVMYSPMCYPNGTTVDDLLIYKLNHDSTDYMLIVNASNTEKDFCWMQEHAGHFSVHIENASDQFGQLSLQGPASADILSTLVPRAQLDTLRYYRFISNVSISSSKVLLSRTGYTGEDGFELYCDAADTPMLWDLLLKAGAAHGLKPIGLGARDTLRFEAGMPLYGHELSRHITPLEANLMSFVKLDKEDFIGKEALLRSFESGVNRRLVGLEMLDKGIAREGYPVLHSGIEIGTVTSGCPSPTLEKNLAMALVDSAHAKVGNPIEVIIRGRQLKARIVPRPFYKRNQ